MVSKTEHKVVVNMLKREVASNRERKRNMGKYLDHLGKSLSNIEGNLERDNITLAKMNLVGAKIQIERIKELM